MFFREIPPEPVDVAVLGGMCSQATEVVAEIVHYWNISLVSGSIYHGCIKSYGGCLILIFDATLTIYISTNGHFSEPTF